MPRPSCFPPGNFTSPPPGGKELLKTYCCYGEMAHEASPSSAPKYYPVTPSRSSMLRQGTRTGMVSIGNHGHAP